jgi:hypothetical protein
MARPKGTKGASGPSQVAPIKADVVKLKLTVSREVARQLRVEALGRDLSLGDLVADLLRSSPRRFVLSERSKGSQGPQDSPGPRLLEVGGTPGVEGLSGGPGAVGPQRPGGVVGLGGGGGSVGGQASG